MTRNLEAPFRNGAVDSGSLYRARGDEVSTYRPIFTGDVFTGLKLPGRTGNEKTRTVMIVQHPCSMRVNGADLAWQVLAAEVSNRRELAEDDWQGNYNLMPLPELRPDVTSAARHQTADFDALYMVKPEQLDLTNRIASLSPFGVNLVLQRWVHYSSRVIVPTDTFQEQTFSFYEEADLLEEWCEEGDPSLLTEESKACVEWLRTEHSNGVTRQDMLRYAQSVSTIRKAMREELKRRRAAEAGLRS